MCLRSGAAQRMAAVYSGNAPTGGGEEKKYTRRRRSESRDVDADRERAGGDRLSLEGALEEGDDELTQVALALGDIWGDWRSVQGRP